VDGLGADPYRGFRKLDAAIFMAQAVDAKPELLPPRPLEPEPESSQELLAVQDDNGEPAPRRKRSKRKTDSDGRRNP
jgi:hypothetical protein